MANLIVTDQLVAQRDVFGNTLVELIDRDPRTYVLDGDLANSTKADIVSRERPDHFLEMGIPPYQLVSTVNMICSQRLVRRLCHKCNSETRAECAACLGSGYCGRVVIAHTAPIDERVRQLVLRDPTSHALRAMLKELGPDLADRASALLGEGITDANEMTRVLGPGITAPGD